MVETWALFLATVFSVPSTPGREARGGGRSLCRARASWREPFLFQERLVGSPEGGEASAELLGMGSVRPAGTAPTRIFGRPHSVWAGLFGQCPSADLRKQAASLHAITPHPCQRKGDIKVKAQERLWLSHAQRPPRPRRVSLWGTPHPGKGPAGSYVLPFGKSRQ